MYLSTRSAVATPPFGGLKRARIHLLPYDLGDRGGRILVRVLYWTYYDHTRKDKCWRAVLYDNAGKIVRESDYAASEDEALQDVLRRFVRLRDAPYLFLHDLFEVFAGGERSTLRFTVYSDKRVQAVAPLPLRRVRYHESRRGEDCDELRDQKVPLLHRYQELSPHRLIGYLSEYRLVDLFHREVWTVGERPEWFAGIRFGTEKDDAKGIDLWVLCQDQSPKKIPIQVTSSEGRRLQKLADQQASNCANAPPIIVAGEGTDAKNICGQLVRACEAYRLKSPSSRRPLLQTA